MVLEHLFYFITRPTDGWTGLCIKCRGAYLVFTYTASSIVKHRMPSIMTNVSGAHTNTVAE